MLGTDAASKHTMVSIYFDAPTLRTIVAVRRRRVEPVQETRHKETYEGRDYSHAQHYARKKAYDSVYGPRGSLSERDGYSSESLLDVLA